MPCSTYFESVYSLTAQRRLSAPKPPIAAMSSMRLLVVAGSAPETSLRCSPATSNAAQPPGPGLPRQAPSVNISTEVMSRTYFRGGLRRTDQHPLPDPPPRPHHGHGLHALACLEQVGAGGPGGAWPGGERPRRGRRGRLPCRGCGYLAGRRIAGAGQPALRGQQAEIAVDAVHIEAKQRDPVAQAPLGQ